MESRQILAYALIAMLAAFAAALVLWRRHHARDRTIARGRRRVREARERRRASSEPGEA